MRKHLLAILLIVGALDVHSAKSAPSDHSQLVPPEKRLDPAWIASLTARGEPQWVSGDALHWMGMPIGGIAAGQLYLGGDGKLWHWDIFNEYIDTGTGGPHYPRPLKPSSPLEQGFAIRAEIDEKPVVRRLDASGFPSVRFRGEYPIGRVEYRDPVLPITVALEAFSPFIPLDPEASSLPATILRFTVTNTGKGKADVELAGWLENAVGLRSGSYVSVTRTNRILRQPASTVLAASAKMEHSKEIREPVVFEKFNGKDFGAWKPAGDAFTGGPKAKPDKGEPPFRGHTGRAASSFGTGKAATGTLTSPEFTINRNFIDLRLMGTNEFAGVHVLVDGQAVRTVYGPGKNLIQTEIVDVRDLAGKTVQLQIFDDSKAGNIVADDITFRDLPPDASNDPEKSPDNGSLSLALVGRGYEDFSSAKLSGNNPAEAAFANDPATSEAVLPFGKPLIGAVGRKLSLEPGASAEVTFVLAWHFPFNTSRPLGEGSQTRHYAKRFADATAVADHVVENLGPLTDQTRLWVKTWYDSTLPFWFLDRTMANTSVLATSTAQWFDDGRFWGWEGVGCCPGTCGHVWLYAQSMARLFPSLERWLRDQVDFGIGMNPETGTIGMRGSAQQPWAVDSQAGYVLRTLREHRTSADDTFLRSVYPRMKKAMQFLISRDTDKDGIVDGPQHNTLDGEWFGKVSWLSSLYLASLRAAEVMATETGDTAFASECRDLADRSRKSIESKLFNGEYFVQIDVPEDKMGETGYFGGCHIDQVFGQSYAFQVGLGRILDAEKTRSALGALYKYNFAPDVGPYRAVNKPGRPYALPGEAGLIMTTWPQGDSRPKGTFAGYLNECMTGFEYQAASHMIAEGMVTEGLAVTRAIHDRYAPSKRNPYNEIEAGDHYARSMASYGVFLAACGFEYDGPKGLIGFDPKLTPDKFRAAFTAAEGWGSFSQKREANRQTNTLEVKWGSLQLNEISLGLPVNTTARNVSVTLDGKPVAASLAAGEGRVIVTLAQPALLATGSNLRIVLELDNANQ